jgi:hypothetical protein
MLGFQPSQGTDVPVNHQHCSGPGCDGGAKHLCVCPCDKCGDTPKVCQHGSLARSCELCERDERIAELEGAVRTSIENVRTLRAAYGGGIAISTHGGEVWERMLTTVLGESP